MSYLQKISAALVITAFVAVALPATVDAASCNFNRDLEMGVDGEDVRCLQKFLNGTGFTVATSGVGSPGNETSLFRTLTMEAVIEWQLANGLPGTGYFGPQSRAVYNKLTNSVSQAGTNLPSGNTSNSNSLGGIDPQEVADLLKIINGDSSSSDKKVSKSAQQNEAEDRIRRAIEELEGEDEYDGDLVDALDNLFSAMLEYFKGNYGEASAEAELAYEDASGKKSDLDEDELEEELERLREKFEDAEEEVDDADDDDYDVDEAEELLDEAEDALDDAEDAIDDEDFDEAEDLLEEAEELIDEALEEVGIDREQEAEDAIDEAEDAIDEAEEAIEEADDNDEDVDAAEDLLEAAKDKLEEAEDAYDDEDWEDAIEAAERAEDYAKDAIDEL